MTSAACQCGRDVALTRPLHAVECECGKWAFALQEDGSICSAMGGFPKWTKTPPVIVDVAKAMKAKEDGMKYECVKCGSVASGDGSMVCCMKPMVQVVAFSKPLGLLNLDPYTGAAIAKVAPVPFTAELCASTIAGVGRAMNAAKEAPAVPVHIACPCGNMLTRKSTDGLAACHSCGQHHDVQAAQKLAVYPVQEAPTVRAWKCDGCARTVTDPNATGTQMGGLVCGCAKGRYRAIDPSSLNLAPHAEVADARPMAAACDCARHIAEWKDVDATRRVELMKMRDQLGTKDHTISELRATVGEQAVRLREWERKAGKR